MAQIVIRNTQDHLALLSDFGWTHSPWQAKRFPTLHAAFVFCAERNVQEAEGLVDFDDPNAAEVVVPMPEELAAGHWTTAEWGGDPVA